MERVILATEQDLIDHIPPLELAPTGSDDAIAAAAIALASSTKSAALVAFTESGATARRLAAHRPSLPLLIFTPHLSVQHQLTLTWGVASFVTTAVTTTDEMIDTVDRLIPEVSGVEQGKTVVVVAGIPPGTPGTTNSIRIQTVSSIRH